MLKELRQGITESLNDASGMPDGFKAVSYTAESINPPCAIVVPQNPYWRTAFDPVARERIPFAGRLLVGIDVLLVTTREAASKEADLADQIIEGAFSALKPTYDIVRCTRPGVVTISGSKYIGSVLTIEEVTEEP